MPAPDGTIIRIAPYRWEGPDPPPEPGDLIVSTGRTAYLLLERRPTSRPGVFRLVCQKLGRAFAIGPGVRVVDLVWDRRERSKRR